LFETTRVNGIDKVVVCFAVSVAVTRKCQAPPRPHTESDPMPPTAVFWENGSAYVPKVIACIWQSRPLGS